MVSFQGIHCAAPKGASDFYGISGLAKQFAEKAFSGAAIHLSSLKPRMKTKQLSQQ
jgi:hypothetical protein